MMTTEVARLEGDNPEDLKAEWLGRLNDLVDRVESWSKPDGWRTRRVDKTVIETRLGKYKVPVLLMEKDTVQVVLNPVGRNIPGAAGAVDLYLAPAYDDVVSLYFYQDRWQVHQVEPLDPSKPAKPLEGKRHEFTEQTILSVLDGMRRHA